MTQGKKDDQTVGQAGLQGVQQLLESIQSDLRGLATSRSQLSNQGSGAESTEIETDISPGSIDHLWRLQFGVAGLNVLSQQNQLFQSSIDLKHKLEQEYLRGTRNALSTDHMATLQGVAHRDIAIEDQWESSMEVADALAALASVFGYSVVATSGNEE